MSLIVKVSNIFRILTRRPILHEEEGFYPWTSEDPVRVRKDGGFGINLDNPKVFSHVIRNFYLMQYVSNDLASRIANRTTTEKDKQYLAKLHAKITKEFK